MKKFKYLVFAVLLSIAFSCEDPLDKGPLGVIGNDVVWDDQNLIESYFSDLYDRADFLIEADRIRTRINQGGMAELSNERRRPHKNRRYWLWTI